VDALATIPHFRKALVLEPGLLVRFEALQALGLEPGVSARAAAFGQQGYVVHVNLPSDG
jgi:hypothetical protein